jgi:uncharacterized protein YndB with AHSA1/START domain
LTVGAAAERFASSKPAKTLKACEPPQRLLLTMRDPDPQPGQPEETVIEAQLFAEGAQTRLVWE